MKGDGMKTALSLALEAWNAFEAVRESDPLEFMISIGGLPVLLPGVLGGLAKLLGGVSKLEAMKVWISVNSTLLPFIHQKQSAIEVRPAGAPGSGQPVFWSITEESGDIEMVDITPSPTNEREDG